MSSFAIILPAAGQSSRFRDPHYKKPFAPLDGKAVWLHSAEKFMQRDDVQQLLVVVSDEEREFFASKFGANIAIMGMQVVTGGATRTASVRAALERVRPEIDFVAVHDAARPVLADKWIDSVFAAAKKYQAAILATPVTSTLKRVRNHEIVETIDRSELMQAQTPQVFSRELLIRAHAQAQTESATDDAELVQRLGHAVRIVEGSPLNLKITTRDDLKLASLCLKALPKRSLGEAHPFANDDMWR